MSKLRLLIPMSIHFSVRYLLRTGLLRLLSDVADPVILLAWEDTGLQQELEQAGAEVHPLPQAQWGRGYERIRSLTNFWYMRRLATPTLRIYERRAMQQRSPYQRIRRRCRSGVFALRLGLPGGTQRLLASEAHLFREDTNSREIARWTAALRADAALSITPYLPSEEMVMRCCVESGIPACASILSFDNITTRGWIPVKFGRYLLWNRHNAEELLRSYPDVQAADVHVVGSPQFDFYRDPSYLWEEREWRRRLGLPAGHPVIFFGGGHYGCAPHEPGFLMDIDAAVECGEIPGNPVILFRNHPVDPIERWQPLLRKARHVVCDNPSVAGSAMGRHNLRREDIEKLASSLYHSQAHVNVASTMTVDGAIFDRPQIGPAYDESPERKYASTVRELYLQEHFLPITRSGGLDIAGSRTAMIAAIRSALEAPARLSAGRKRIVREICTYDDGKCAMRAAGAVISFLGASSPPSGTA